MRQKRLVNRPALFLIILIGLALGLHTNAQEPPLPEDGMLAPPIISMAGSESASQPLSSEEREHIVQQAMNELWRYIPDAEAHRPTPLTPTADNGQIAYVGADGHLYLMNPDGTAQCKIVDDLSNLFEPAWSHDNQNLVFWGDGEGGRCLYKFNLETSTHTALVCGFVTVRLPEWSPQSSRIVFIGEQEAGTGYHAWALDADGNNLRELAPGIHQTWRPVWVDEDTVALPGETSNVWRLYSVDFDQPDNPQPLTPGFACSSGCSCDENDVLLGFPDTSPDGQYMAFVGGRTESNKYGGCSSYYAVYLVDPDPATGDPPVKIVDVAASGSGTASAGILKWAPDNQRVGMRANGSDGVMRLNVVDTASSTLSVLHSREDGGWNGFDWAPDATRLAVGYSPSGVDPEIDSMDPISDTFTVLAYGRNPAWGTLPPLPPSEMTDLTVRHIEVTQGLQDWEQTVRLIEGKATFARAYVTATVDTPGVTAGLLGTLNGQPLPDSPLPPLNSGRRIIVRADGGERTHINDSFYFHLPDSWLVEGAELTAHVDPDSEIPETVEINNTASVTLPQFVATEPVHIVFIRIIDPSEPTKVPEFGDARLAATWLEQTYPIRDLKKHNWPVPVLCSLNSETCRRSLTIAFGLLARELSIGILPDFRVHGIVHQDVGGSLLGEGVKDWGSWSQVGRVVPPLINGHPISDTDPRHHFGRIMAHEVGHTYGLLHVNPGEIVSGCIKTDQYTTTPPYLDASIGVPTDTKSYYGFDASESPPRVYESTAHDMMTYCFDRYWISYGTSKISGTFDSLLDSFRATSRLTVPGAMFPDDQLWLAASGIVTPMTGLLELFPFYVLPDLAPSYDPQPGDYSIELYDSGDALLVSHPFTLTYVTSSPPLGSQQVQTESDPSALFLEVLPFDPAAAYIQVKHSDTVLSVVPVSAHSPQITVTYPNSGEVLTGTVSVTWSADDEDGDALSYAVRYSPDNGTTWIALAVDLTDEIYELDTSRLPGADLGVIQVIATDGVNTVTDSSDEMLLVPLKAPAVYIALPTDGSVLPGDTAVVLVGSAYDPEDGPLAGSQLAWASSLDGNLGTGELLFAQDLTHGWHAITLTATDSYSSQASASVEVLVMTPAQAAFTASPTAGFAPLTVAFDNTSSGDYTECLWNFGDGVTSSLESPTHTYTAAGTYSVTLTVRGLGGVDTLTRTNYIAVYEAVSAGFTASLRYGPAPHTVHFTDTSTGPVDTWGWDFGDGETSILRHPVHTYSMTGVYTVSLTVQAAEGSAIWPGGTDTLTRTGYVAVYEPVEADFTANPQYGPAPHTVQFFDASTGPVATWEWTFGDGVISTLRHPVHTYATTGAYTVGLTVRAAGGSATLLGGTDTLTRTGYIGVYEGVYADFTASTRYGPAPHTVHFTDTSTGPAATWEWNFGDGMFSALQHPSHTYAMGGVYAVGLTVRAAGGSATWPGGTDTLTQMNYVTVYTPPQASFFAWPTRGMRPLTVAFIDTSSGDYTNSLWDFGDGLASTLESPIHIYAEAGVYTITLAISGLGGSDTEMKPAYITVEEVYSIYLPLVMRNRQGP